MEQESSKIGLKINEAKTKYLVMSRDAVRRQAQDLTIGDRNFEGVSNFCILRCYTK